MARVEIAVLAIGALFGLGCSDDAASGGTGGNAGSGASSGSGGTGASGGGGSTGMGSACGPLIETARCMDSGWCWEAPTPFGSDFYGIDGTSDGTSVWAVGSLGGAFRNCQGRWQAMETGTSLTLYDVWHPSSSFALAVGAQGLVLRWDGKSLSKIASPTELTLRAVWGSAPDDVWIGGDRDPAGGTLLFHFDGNQFTRVPELVRGGFRIYGIAGRTANDVYVVGGNFSENHSLHFDGSTWQTLAGAAPTGDGGPFTDVVAYADGTTLALYQGVNFDGVYRLTNGAWQESYLKPPRLTALFALPSGDPAIVEATDAAATSGRVLRFDGNGWAPSGELLDAWPSSIWSQRGGPAWGVGAETTLLARKNDGSWSQVDGVISIAGRPWFLGGMTEDALWLVTDQDLFQKNASGWKHAIKLPGFASVGAVDLAGRPYVQINSDLMYLDGTSLTTLPRPSDSASQILAISPDDIWTAGQYPAHFAGGVWTSLSSGCGALTGSAQNPHVRQAPDGRIWIAKGKFASVFDPQGRTCQSFALSDASAVGYDVLVDLAWAGGELFAITQLGRLYRREGDVLVAKKELFSMPSKLHVVELIGTKSGKLRVVFFDASVNDGPVQVATLDPSGAITLGPPTVAPETGVLWTRDEAHATFALQGGVLRHGY